MQKEKISFFLTFYFSLHSSSKKKKKQIKTERLETQSRKPRWLAMLLEVKKKATGRKN